VASVKANASRKSKNLVLARVGRNSLHGEWLDATTPRNWDLRLVPFQEIAPQDDLDLEVGQVIVGPKWSGLRELLNSWDGWRDYDYVWMPDDDIAADQETISRMFDVAEALGLDLFAPALHESSYYAHFITMENRSFYGRWVGFVEIMMPGFSRRALEKLLPTLDLTETGWGWGLDSLWPKLLDYRNVAIIDGTPVVHTRPVGQMRDAELARRVMQESDRILASNDCRQMHTTFGAFDANLERLEIGPERLLVEIVKGSDYLIERDPRVLRWIADYQRPHFPWPEYPIAGTPDAAAAGTEAPV
jgi:hypothetical protein